MKMENGRREQWKGGRMEGWKEGRQLRRPLRWRTPAPQCGTGVPARHWSLDISGSENMLR